jgi:5-methylcytosine-specific restriction endonuclease McrA
MARRPTNKERGYTSRWDRLSRQARASARFCAICGRVFTPDDSATTDHIDPIAEYRPRLPAPVRVRVVHRSCNSRRARELERAQREASPKRRPTRSTLVTGKPGHRVWWGAIQPGDVAPPRRDDTGPPRRTA